MYELSIDKKTLKKALTEYLVSNRRLKIIDASAFDNDESSLAYCR